MTGRRKAAGWTWCLCVVIGVLMQSLVRAGASPPDEGSPLPAFPPKRPPGCYETEPDGQRFLTRSGGPLAYAVFENTSVRFAPAHVPALYGRQYGRPISCGQQVTALGAHLQGGLLVAFRDPKRRVVRIEHWTFDALPNEPEVSQLVPLQKRVVRELEVSEPEQVRFLLPNLGRPHEAFVVFWKHKSVHTLDLRSGTLAPVIEPPADAGGTRLERALRDHRLSASRAIDHVSLGYVYLLSVDPYPGDEVLWGAALVDADRDGRIDLQKSYALQGGEAWEPFASSDVYRAVW